MNREEFRNLLRDLLFNIHDVAVLEKHPANDFFPRPNPGHNRAENLRRVIREGIEALRPAEGPINAGVLEWRYYLILRGRYVEGESIAESQRRLSLGERQERRLHGRALSALENILWNMYLNSTAPGEFSPTAIERAAGDPDSEEDRSYQITLEHLNLERIVQDVAYLCIPRIEASGGNLALNVPDVLPQVQSDRIILRQIMLELVSRIILLWPASTITVSAIPVRGQVVLNVEVGSQGALALANRQQAMRLEENDIIPEGQLRYWLERLNIRLAVENNAEDPDIQARFSLSMPRANQKVILVVDDHEQAVRIIQRYLNQTNIQAIGVTDPLQVLTLARAARPQAVLLDIMMPTLDGWELLQVLKSDPETKDIPVIICSVWDQPDLAFSLGANGFLKKPISQVELLEVLARSNLLDTSGESLPANS